MESSTQLPEVGIYPEQVLNRINVNLDQQVLVNDIGQHRHPSAIFYHAPCPRDFFTSAGLSSFGCGLGFAIGTKLAVGDRPVVLIAGEGGFQSTLGDLETLKRLKLKVLIVIYENNKSSLIERYQIIGAGRTNRDVLDFGVVDYVALAEAHGIPGKRAESLEDVDSAISALKDGSTAYLTELPINYPNNYVNEFNRNYHVKS